MLSMFCAIISPGILAAIDIWIQIIRIVLLYI
jgi:hypothetical protein